MRQLAALLVVGIVLPSALCRAEAKPDVAEAMVNDQGTWFRADAVVTARELGTTITAQPGALLDVTLAENPTTGYMWKCTWQPAAALTLVRSTAVGPATQLVGAGGTRHFLLLVNQPVRTRVTVQYGRWWEKGERDEPLSLELDATVPPALTIHGAEFAGEVTLKVGQTAEVILPANPSTGFSWMFTYTPPGTILEVVSNTYVQGKPDVPGGAGEKHMLLRAKQVGKCVITAQYQRLWEGGTKQRPRALTVKVVP
jgi:predicted secreted protein